MSSQTSSSSLSQRHALVLYPETESYTTKALLKAFKSVLPNWTVHTARKDNLQYDLQYSDYDEIDWDAAECSTTLTNSYMLRKALIRKHYLATAVAHRLAKNPDSLLSKTIPKTYTFEIAHADELDELFYDELYEVSEALEAQPASNGDDAEKGQGKRKWWILKPAMTDKGQGIRLFDNKEALQDIFNSFEDEDSDDDDEDEEASDNDHHHHHEEDGEGGGSIKNGVSASSHEERATIDHSTSVRLSNMRDWVIQEYLEKPLLFDTNELLGRSTTGKGRKFHLRVYVLAVGDLELYVYTDMLALFAGADFELPGASHGEMDDDDAAIQDLAAHLTNTCLQSDQSAKESVFLLRDLLGKHILSPTSHKEVGQLSLQQIDHIIDDIGETVAETFRAGLGMANHFQPVGNAFEVFGVDVMLSQPLDESERIPVHLLEVNACPDFRQTGPERHHVIEQLFEGVMRIAVGPFFDDNAENKKYTASWQAGQRRDNWLKCMDCQHR